MFFNLFGESNVTHNNKLFRMILINNNHSMSSATSQKLLSWKRETLRFSEIVNADPKWQCKFCLNHCSAGVIYCQCGRLMTKDAAENKRYISGILDTFSIPHLYIRKNRPRGHRYGKAPGCKEYHTAHQLAKKCRKKGYDSIHDPVHPRQDLQKSHDWSRSLWTDDHRNGQACEWGPHTHSPYRTSTSERTDHTVTGTGKLQDAKNTIRRINLQRNVVRRNTTASTTSSSATRPSEKPWLKSVALNKWLSRWTSLRKRTTPTLPAGKNLSSTVAIGGSTQICSTLIQYLQGMNPNLKVRCQQCIAWNEQRIRKSKKHRHKRPHLRLRGTGIEAGGSLILSTHLKNGMTTDDTGKPVLWWLDIYLREESHVQKNLEFLLWNR